ncbi:kxDL motif-containing protein LO9-177 [Physcomitrium patens]|uniref:KxDL domain-containing protein n=1 Tax=Physcomitrium patens TaxID=3218 RepID=A0A2K1J4F4_PHYPA|nr:kxDL motif-containing protein 1-like [Physcomitrium patens]PNR36415.1 hypothetical protein PHYPA_022266 [Physcomitrium patens]|eukprot:XP_024400087.1 kxDL motif-containing protein 1-like [Physcomitrella patens]
MEPRKDMAEKDVASIAAASSATAEKIHSLLSASDVGTLKHQQLLILGRLQDSNAVLSHFNDFSDRSFTAVANDFSQNTRLLKSMKSDLDYVFRKIGSLKARIQKHYPDAFKDAVPDCRPDLDLPK